MAYVKVQAGGVYGDSNIYEGREVVVIYYQRDFGWVMERGIVTSGRVEIEGEGPLTGDQYWVGIPYTSRMKTFPLRDQGRMNQKSRISKVRLFLDKRSGEMLVRVGDETGSVYSDTVRWKKDKNDGVIDVNIGTSYAEEPYIAIEASGVEPVKILGVDAEYRAYEGG